MDGLDGGAWNYGDGSFPWAERTLHAGTYNKHPLSMAAAYSVLTELERRGPSLQEGLNRTTERLVKALNEIFSSSRVPIQVKSFGSLFRFESHTDLDLFFMHLIEKGVYTWEGRTCYLSAAHTTSDLDAIVGAVTSSLGELQDGGFFLSSAGRKARLRSFSP